MCGDHAPESQSVMYRRKTGRKGVGGNWNLELNRTVVNVVGVHVEAR